MEIGFNTIFSKNNRITVVEAKKLAESGESVEMVLPLSFRLTDGSWWTFPVEPLISISGKNSIIRRNVAKSERRGSIKERWAEDDLQITIQGAFVHADPKVYPSDDVQTFTEAITQRKAIEVKNELLLLLGVNQIVVESYALPFTKGENRQDFNFTAYSDDLYQLFIEVKDV
ncbi:MAG: DUF6046 domain-containing protein [Bacteroidales bacterium]